MVTFTVMSSGVTSAASAAKAFGDTYLKQFATLPLWLVAAAVVTGLALINFRGVGESMKANVLLTCIELSGLLIIIGAGMWAIGQGQGDASRLVEVDTSNSGVLLSITAATSLAFFAMVGFEDSVNMAEETKDPVKIFPRAMLIGMGVAATIYVLVAVVASTLVPAHELAAAKSGALLKVLQVSAPGFPLQLFGAIGLLAVINSALINMLMASRLLYGMANERILPGVFGTVHPTRRTPWVSILFTSVIAYVLVVSVDLSVTRATWTTAATTRTNTGTDGGGGPVSGGSGRLRNEAPARTSSMGAHPRSLPAVIVVGGEALVDLVPSPGTRDPSGPLLPRWGGGPYNVAVALGRLGVPARFLSRLSTDPFGTAMLDRLRRTGVDISLVQRGPEPTTLAVVGLEPSGSARYGFYTNGTADRLITDPGPLPDDTAAVALGTLSLVLEPGASAYEAVLLRESQAGRLISLDPNIRPDLITDPDGYRRRFRSWLPSVGLVKVSDEDAAWLGMHHPDEWLRAGVGAVVITRGGDGLSVVSAAGQVDVPGVPTVVADTIGAGDTAHAALLARLYAHDALDRNRLSDLDLQVWRDVLSFAALAASHTCARPGAEPPTAAELKASAPLKAPN